MTHLRLGSQLATIPEPVEAPTELPTDQQLELLAANYPVS